MIFRLLIILLIVAIAGAVFYSLNSEDAEESPLLKGLGEVRSLVKETEPESPKETIVYKWQDKDGAWHFSNQPPPEGVASSVTTYRSDINVVPSPKTDNPPEDKPRDNPGNDPADPPLIPIADPARVKQLIDDAKNVQHLMNDRQQQIDEQ